MQNQTTNNYRIYTIVSRTNE